MTVSNTVSDFLYTLHYGNARNGKNVSSLKHSNSIPVLSNQISGSSFKIKLIYFSYYSELKVFFDMLKHYKRRC